MKRWTWGSLLLAALLVGGFLWDDEEPGRARDGRAGTKRESPAAHAARASEPDPPVQKHSERDATVAPPAAEEPLPACYFGPIRLRGVVVDDDGPVADAAVHIELSKIHPYTDRHARRFRTRSAANGAFEFVDLPYSGAYRITASVPFRMGHVTIEEVPGDAIEVKLGPVLFYERWEFYTPEGEPVPIEGRTVALHGILVGSFRGSVPDLNARRMPELLPPPHVLPAHVAVNVYRGRNVLRMPGKEPLALAPRSRTLDVPGFQPVEVPYHRRRAEEWPAATRVVLTPGPPNDGQVVYTVVFPDARPPDAWRPFETPLARAWFPTLCVDLIEPQGEEQILLGRATPSQNRVVADATSDLELRLGPVHSAEPLPYRAISGPDGVRIEPDWPALTWITVRYAPVQGEAAARATYVWVAYDNANSMRQMIARRPHPGIALLGPLPPGDYRLVRVRQESRGGVTEKSELALGRIEPGHLEIEWDE